jgi:2-dehydro-3-deoxygluconokinase
MDWSLLSTSRLLHIDSIVPVLYPDSIASLETGLAAAKDAGCRICVCMDDTIEACSDDARQRVFSIAEQADVIIATRAAAECISEGTDTLEGLSVVLKNRFRSSVAAVVEGSLPTPRAGVWQGIALEDTVYRDRSYDLEVIDSAGAFSAFAGGFLYGYLEEGVDAGLRYGNAAAALAHSVPGNLPWITAEEITSQFSGAGSKLQR